MTGTSPARKRRHASAPPLVAAVAVALALGALTASPASAATADPLSVDFSHTTGAFRGGATGTLYGLSDEGVPSQAVLNGARVTNTSQKPPSGAQHPNGDALQVESSFFAGGGQDLYVYAQDMYPDWAYNGGARPGDANGDGVWDYLPILQQVVDDIATTSAHPEKYVFVPFNEPDAGNWYPNWSTQKTQFLADWSAAYDTIQAVYAAHGLGHARVGGPGDASWHADRSTDFLAYAKANAELPDVFIWHELGTNNLATFRSNHAAYQQILRDLGIAPIPVNITEYGMLRDMGVPGQLVQWLSMFEDEKVDAQTAYWNYAGNLSDNSSRSNGANGGWWMFRWYGDLAGSQTAELTPPFLNSPDSLQGIAAIDSAARKATVLFGGGSNDVAIDAGGLDSAVFGTTVNVQVRADRLNGAEGASLQPPVILSTTAAVTDGRIQVTVPNSDRYSAYRLEITPRLAHPQPVSADLVSSVEAESTTLANATVYSQDPSREWSFMASGGRDVGSFNRAGSSASWDVTVPSTGDYRLQVLSGANQAPGTHALFVDDAFDTLVNYSADLSWTYRGTADATVQLTAGTHRLSLRASADGSTALPGADITLDRFDLFDVTAGEKAVYPAVESRLTGGAALDWSRADASGYASVAGSATATVYATTAATGFYDVTTHFVSTAPGTSLTLRVGGRDVPLAAVASGTYDATARLYLPQGVNELAVRASAGAALVGAVTTLRGAEQKASEADPALVFRSDAESLPRSGSAIVQTVAAGSNGSADAQGVVRDVGYIGNGAANTVTVPRSNGFGAGDYQVVIGAANADKSAAINYNPQVISRFLDITETGGGSARAAFRHNYAWNSYWDTTVPLELTTEAGALTLGNATAFGPNIDTITLARFVAASPQTEPAASATATSVVLSGPAAVQPNGDADLVATLTPADAAGSVEFFDGATSLGSATVAGGVARFTARNLAVGTHSFTAVFTPSDPGAFGASTADPFTVTVSADAPLLALSAATGKAGDEVTVTGTRFTPSSTVSFTFTSTPVPLGSATTDADGALSFAFDVPEVGSGSHTVTASVDGVMVASAAFVVVPADAGGPSGPTGAADGAGAHSDGLASTGFTIAIGAIALALVLLAAGGALLALRARRRRGQAGM